MVNAQALREIIPVIRELAAQQRFDMTVWAYGEVNPHAASYQECGTQFCLAGAKAVVDGWFPRYEISTNGGYVATGEFAHSRRDQEIDSDYAFDGRGREAFVIARDGFGLSQNQAAWLFRATHIRNVEHMVTRIQWLIDNPQCDRPELDYPDHLFTAELD